MLRGRAVRAALLALGGVSVILAGIALTAPFLLRTPQGLALVESLADGLPVGPVGHLEVSGLAGDPPGGVHGSPPCDPGQGGGLA